MHIQKYKIYINYPKTIHKFMIAAVALNKKDYTKYIEIGAPRNHMHIIRAMYHKCINTKNTLTPNSVSNGSLSSTSPKAIYCFMILLCLHFFNFSLIHSCELRVAWPNDKFAVDISGGTCSSHCNNLSKNGIRLCTSYSLQTLH
ncbi:unnamed protein product [Camellia sinensis]